MTESEPPHETKTANRPRKTGSTNFVGRHMPDEAHSTTHEGQKSKGWLPATNAPPHSGEGWPRFRLITSAISSSVIIG